MPYGRYGYSLMFAADMYATVFAKDPLDPARGRLYREKILRPGAAQDELETLKVNSFTGHALCCLFKMQISRASSVAHPAPRRSIVRSWSITTNEKLCLGT